MPKLTGPILTRADFGEVGLKRYVKNILDQKAQEAEPTYPKFMNVKTIEDAWDETLVIGGFERVPMKDEGGPIALATPYVGGVVRVQPDSYALMFGITYEDKQDDKLGKVRRFSEELMATANSTVEIVAATPWNLAFDPSFVGYDGQPLCSTSHVLVTPNIVTGATTCSNRLAVNSDLSQSALYDALDLLLQMVNTSGRPIYQHPAFLLVHPSNYGNAIDVTQNFRYYNTRTTTQAWTGMEAKYLQQFNLEVIQWPYLTDTDAWWVIAPKNAHHVNLVWRQKPTLKMFEDDETMNTYVAVYFRVTAGFEDWVGVAGTPGG